LVELVVKELIKMKIAFIREDLKMITDMDKDNNIKKTVTSTKDYFNMVKKPLALLNSKIYCIKASFQTIITMEKVP
jgi:hypothetical protein